MPAPSAARVRRARAASTSPASLAQRILASERELRRVADQLAASEAPPWRVLARLYQADVLLHDILEPAA